MDIVRSRLRRWNNLFNLTFISLNTSSESATYSIQSARPTTTIAESVCRWQSKGWKEERVRRKADRRHKQLTSSDTRQPASKTNEETPATTHTHTHTHSPAPAHTHTPPLSGCSFPSSEGGREYQVNSRQRETQINFPYVTSSYPAWRHVLPHHVMTDRSIR